MKLRAADAPADIAQPAVYSRKAIRFDRPYDDLVKQWEAERPVVTASDIEEDIATVDVAPAVGVQQVEESVAPISAADDTLSADEQMSLDDILLTIPVDIPLPSSSMEITKISMGKSIKIPGVSKWTWFLKSLPRISAEDKGKEVLVEKDPVKGNPAKEHYSLICADIELLVSLRAQVIDEVASFFHSFSLKKLATINFEEMYRKEEQVLSWGETESPQEAIQRKFYILLKYRTVLVWKFLDAWRANFVLAKALRLLIFKGSADKKGESGSRGLQQPASTQIEGSAVTPSFAQRVEMAKRHIVHTVLDADRDTAERDRERRRKEASEYRFEFQRVLLRIGKRQRFDKLERRRWSAQFRSAD
ncbi:ras-related protein Rab11D-like [Dorcoceras hygrometricum]|uniref:Ras-related protein Rab11D-like n=1 Tax=Dorcoceras hygrometricum TaxID=472368 RepID=A0A2Z7AZS0_9LAMI|nr:ras-related protein Rab11D-like [Dorcoceras hygrometricum]